MKPKVFITRPLSPSVVELVAKKCDVSVHPEDAALQPAELAEACQEAEGVLVVGARITEEVLRRASKLKIVANCGVGYDHIDVAACTARRIVVTNTPEVLTDTTADLAFALLMATARRIAEGDRFVREGRWQRSEWGLLWGTDVFGRTLGLYGFGRIGRTVAWRALGFSMRVLYYDQVRPPLTVERELKVQYAERETLLRESDFLSLHLPLTPQTRHVIGAAELALMKPTAILINAARGQVVDEEALVQALQAKKIAGAGLDVFEHEPRVHPALLEMPNVVLLPHVGSATAETRFKMAMLAAENLLAALDGGRPPNVVNPEVYK
jgi:gluconate 2-dehydrogenase